MLICFTMILKQIKYPLKTKSTTPNFQRFIILFFLKTRIQLPCSLLANICLASFLRSNLKIKNVFSFHSSITVAKHKQFLRELEDQRPDSVLRQRKKQLARYTNNELEVSQNFQSPNQTNAYMKLAVWTLTASVGTMALYVLSTAKRWI